MPRLLLTGFEPFGRHRANPSWDALQLARELGLLSDDVHLACIPVTYDGAFPALEAAVERVQPAALLCFGLHGGMKGRGAATIYVEARARNRDAAGLADNAGKTRAGQEIRPGRPEALNGTIPAAEMTRALAAEGFESEVSEDAGAYLCNHLYYRALEGYGGRFPCGFVHVPPVEEDGGILRRESLARAMSVMAQFTITHVQARQR